MVDAALAMRSSHTMPETRPETIPTVPDAAPVEHQELWDNDAVTAYGLLREAAAELENLMRNTLKRSGLQMAMFELLVRLARSQYGRRRLTSLARELTVTTGGVTRLVDRAELNGLVRREPCPDDARGYYAVITDEGRRRLRSALPEHLADVRTLWVSQLGEDRAVVLERVRRVRDNARRLAGHPDSSLVPITHA